MPSAIEAININSSADRVFQIIRRFEEYPRFIPLVKEVKILSPESDRTMISEWRAEIDGILFHWIERDEFDHEDYVIRYSLIEGDMEQYEGHWRIKNSNDGIELELLMQYSLGVPSIEELIGLVMHNSLTESAKEMLLR